MSPQQWENKLKLRNATYLPWTTDVHLWDQAVALICHKGIPDTLHFGKDDLWHQGEKAWGCYRAATCGAMFSTWREDYNHIRDHHISLDPVGICQCRMHYWDTKFAQTHLQKVHNI